VPFLPGDPVGVGEALDPGEGLEVRGCTELGEDQRVAVALRLGLRVLERQRLALLAAVAARVAGTGREAVVVKAEAGAPVAAAAM